MIPKSPAAFPLPSNLVIGVSLQASSLPILRGPLDAGKVLAALRRPQLWDIRHVSTIGSTNDELARGEVWVTQPGASPVLVTQEQTAGRGRLGRGWACPSGAGLMFSVRLLLPEVPSSRRGWVGAVLGLAVVSALSQLTLTPSSLKWPNDVLLAGRKFGGILAEMVGDAVIVGTGLNISLQQEELPRADATSLLLAGEAVVDREALLAAILDHFGELLGDWRAAGGDIERSGLRAQYLSACSTIGSAVRVELPHRPAVRGIAVDVDASGAIVVQDVRGSRTSYHAGDVVHLRPEAPVG